MRTWGRCAILCCLLSLLLIMVLLGCGTVFLSPLVREDIKLLSGHCKYPLKVAVITGNMKGYNKFTPDKRRGSYYYSNGKRRYYSCFFDFVDAYKDFFPRVFDQVDFLENYPLNIDKYDLIVKLCPTNVNDVTKDSRKYAELKMEADVVFYKVNRETLLRLNFVGSGQSSYGTETVKYPDIASARSYIIRNNYYHAAKNVTRSIFQQLASELTQHPNQIDEYVNYLARLKQEEIRRNALPANLIAQIQYSDKTSLLPNSSIDAGEKSTISATITNSGKGTAFDVKLNTECDFPCVDFDKVIDIGEIPPGESKKLLVKLYGRLDLKNGAADMDGDGFIDVNEISSYLNREVPKATGQKQHPVKKGEAEGQVVIGRVKIAEKL